MILFFRVIVVIVLYINFRLRANKLNIMFLFNIFIELKFVCNFILKLIGGVVVFLFLNYLSYIYYRVGLRIHYGVIFLYAFFLVLVIWVMWLRNGFFHIMRHFLPKGIEGVLKLFIPLLEMVGVTIRPVTLAVRLATNISCGHVVLLIFRFFAFNIRRFLVVCIRVLLLGLYFIEFLVCVIQAYVFRRSLYIYLIEVEI